MLLPGEIVPVAFVSSFVMLCIAAAAAAMYVLHIRDERRFAEAMGHKRPEAEPVENALTRAWQHHRAMTSDLLTVITILTDMPGTSATGSTARKRNHVQAQSEHGPERL